MNREQRVLIVAGSSVLLQRVAQKLESRPHVSMMNTANAMLWDLRRIPATHVLAATELDDFDARELADIVPALDPAVQLILCGPETPELAHVRKHPNVELVSSVHQLAERLVSLELGPLPQSPAPVSTLPSTTDDTSTTPGHTEYLVASGTFVLDETELDTMERVLQALAAETQADAVLLSDLAGMTVTQVGVVPPEAGPLYAPMLGTLFFAGAELGRLLDGADAHRLYVHGGARHQLYALAVGEQRVLSVVRAAAEPSNRQPVLAALQRASRTLAEKRKL